MINLTSSTRIYRPVSQVFHFISAPENDFQWQYGTLASAQISEGTPRVGTIFRTTSHLMGHRIQSTFEVTEYEPDKRYGFKSISGPLQSHTAYHLENSRGCTEIAVSTQAIAVNLLEFNEVVIGKKLGRQLKEDLALLKEILEQSRAKEIRSDFRL